MADDFTFSIIGIEALQAKLKAIDDDMRYRNGRAALRKAGNVIVKNAKKRAALIDDPGTGRSIVDNIAMRWSSRLFKQTGNLGFRIGVLHGAVLQNHPDLGFNAPTPHWRLIEFGTEKMRARPFMRPAMDDNTNLIVSTFVNSYSSGIDRALARAAFNRSFVGPSITSQQRRQIFNNNFVGPRQS